MTTPQPGFAAALLTQLVSDPGRIVLRRRQRDIPAQELLDRAGLAAGHIAAALPPGAMAPRVGLMLGDNLDAIAAAIGCWLVGAEVHYLDHRIPAPEVAAVAGRDQCDLLLSHRRLPAGGDISWVVLPGLDPAKAAPGLVEAGRGRIVQALTSALSADAPAEVATSSGVSGPPRLYPVDQGAMLKNITNITGNGRRGDWGTALVALNLCFGGARVVCWRNLLAGRMLVLMDLMFSTTELDRALQDPQVQECTLPPVLIRALVRHHQTTGDCSAPRYPHLVKLQSIGGPASAEEKLAACELLSPRYLITYSSTETGIIARLEGEDLRLAPGSSGRVLPGREIEIVGPEGTPLPPCEIGLIRVRRPLAPPDRQYAIPGDLGWLDGTGFLFVTGRGDGIICRRGENFAASTIEAQLLQDDGLIDAAVLVLPGETGDDGILFALHPAEGVERVVLVERLVARLPALRRPDAVIFTAEGDTTAGGKIRRARLRDRCLAQQRAPDRAPDSSI